MQAPCLITETRSFHMYITIIVTYVAIRRLKGIHYPLFPVTRTTIAALETRNGQFPELGCIYLPTQWDLRTRPTDCGVVTMLLTSSAQPL
jgi:hypothetical protein